MRIVISSCITYSKKSKIEKNSKKKPTNPNKFKEHLNLFGLFFCIFFGDFFFKKKGQKKFEKIQKNSKKSKKIQVFAFSKKSAKLPYFAFLKKKEVSTFPKKAPNFQTYFVFLEKKSSFRFFQKKRQTSKLRFFEKKRRFRFFQKSAKLPNFAFLEKKEVSAFPKKVPNFQTSFFWKKKNFFWNKYLH